MPIEAVKAPAEHPILAVGPESTPPIPESESSTNSWATEPRSDGQPRISYLRTPDGELIGQDTPSRSAYYYLTDNQGSIVGILGTLTGAAVALAVR